MPEPNLQFTLQSEEIATPVSVIARSEATWRSELLEFHQR